MRRLSQRLCDPSATALIEFALVCPALLLMGGGLTDFGLMVWTRHRLASAVAQAAAYAFDTGSNVSADAIKAVVQATPPLSAATVDVTGPACYCVSGSPAQLATQNCDTPCSDGTAPGRYVAISATYVYQPLMPLFSRMTDPTVQQSAVVRVQ